MESQIERHLEWEGAFNVRDLGGLPTTDGRKTRYGAVVRADSLDRLTPAGWEAVAAHGIRTVIDLRNDDKGDRGIRVNPAPPAIETVQVALDQIDDTEFWKDWWSGWQFGTPLYYGPHLERYPQNSVAVVAAVARAQPGGVVFHCFHGRDRTGMIAMLLLAFAGVAPEDIAADYVLSAERLGAFAAARGEPDPSPAIEAVLAERGTSAGELIVDLVESLDVEGQLRAGGLSDRELEALRERLVESG